MVMCEFVKYDRELINWIFAPSEICLPLTTI